MTFVTPTLLAGDRSLVDVVAHEIAHSWTGTSIAGSPWHTISSCGKHLVLSFQETT